MSCVSVRLAFLLATIIIAAASNAETVELTTASASCKVELDGARILSFRAGGREVLWNAKPMQLTAKDWAHGGIPICWPWFGVNGNGDIHGFAWRRRFAVQTRKNGNYASELGLALTNGTTRLYYRITLTDILQLEMTVHNAATNELAFSAGFHPYIMVSERNSVSVFGLDGLTFEDDPSFPTPMRGVWNGTLHMTSTIDRIFKIADASRAVFRIEDPLMKRAVAIEATGASDVNVWNPGSEKNCPGFVPDDEWRHFVCVEPILIGSGGGTVLVGPDAKRSMRMTISVIEL